MTDKLLVVIVSDDETKARVGIQMAGHMIERRTLGDVRVLFFGPSERLLANPPATLVEPLATVRAAGTPMACRAVAEGMEILEPLAAAGIELVPAGQEIAQRILDGYEVMTF
ncbi:MAG: hypothetical protein M0T75_11780 [Chloroflexi bacterium]|nr:hypothetical protein [Chloroflexota bacterium]